MLSLVLGECFCVGGREGNGEARVDVLDREREEVATQSLGHRRVLPKVFDGQVRPVHFVQRPVQNIGDPRKEHLGLRKA